MFFKTVLAICAQALFIQGIFAQFIGAPCTGAWGVPYGAELDYAPVGLSASNGPGVAVTTASPLLPAGVSVLSENAYEGVLSVDGTLPFLGTAAIEGSVPSAGTGVVAYTCGNGIVGITAEDGAPLGTIGALGAGIGGPVGYAGVGAPVVAAPGSAGTWGAPYAIAEQAYIPAASLAASNGPGLTVSSVSSLIPSGVSVQSENIYEGDLAAGGTVPFLGTVSFEGALPTAGAGSVGYSCSNGALGITTEDIRTVGFKSIEAPLGYGSALSGPLSIARSSWGCGAI